MGEGRHRTTTGTGFAVSLMKGLMFKQQENEMKRTFRIFELDDDRGIIRLVAPTIPDYRHDEKRFDDCVVLEILTKK